MRVLKATDSRYRINIVSGGKGLYILIGVTEKQQGLEIHTIVWVFQLLFAGIVYLRRNKRKSNSMAGFCASDLMLHNKLGHHTARRPHMALWPTRTFYFMHGIKLLLFFMSFIHTHKKRIKNHVRSLGWAFHNIFCFSFVWH